MHFLFLLFATGFSAIPQFRGSDGKSYDGMVRDMLVNKAQGNRIDLNAIFNDNNKQGLKRAEMGTRFSG